MKRLFFDVSTNVMYVAYARKDMLKDFSIRIATRDHAKYLIDRIEQLLKRNRLTIEQIDEIVIGIGPGSYTGIRIAVMVGKMLAFARNIPLRTVSSLFFMSSGYDQAIAPLIDARRGNVFSAVYHQGETLLEDGLRSLAELSKTKAYQSAENIFIDENNYEVNIKRILEKSTIVENIHTLVPNYLRKTEAEMNHDQQSQND